MGKFFDVKQSIVPRSVYACIEEGVKYSKEYSSEEREQERNLVIGRIVLWSQTGINDLIGPEKTMSYRDSVYKGISIASRKIHEYLDHDEVRGYDEEYISDTVMSSFVEYEAFARLRSLNNELTSLTKRELKQAQISRIKKAAKYITKSYAHISDNLDRLHTKLTSPEESSYGDISVHKEQVISVIAPEESIDVMPTPLTNNYIENSILNNWVSEQIVTESTAFAQDIESARYFVEN